MTWEMQDEPWVDSALAFLYTGFRISELLVLKTADVSIDTNTIKGGTKTKVEKDRIVPIHSRIVSIQSSHLGFDFSLRQQGITLLFLGDTRLLNWRTILDKVVGAISNRPSPSQYRSIFPSKFTSEYRISNNMCMRFGIMTYLSIVLVYGRRATGDY